MNRYQPGEVVYAKLGALPAVGTVICRDERTGKYLIRFSAVQQDWYGEEEIAPIPGADSARENSDF